MRPKKTRVVKCAVRQRVFRPEGKSTLPPVLLTLDEFEAIRLLDQQGLSQTEAARLMKVHRSTVSRIASAARQKIATALVNIQTLKIEGGCCKIIKQGASHV